MKLNGLLLFIIPFVGFSQSSNKKDAILFSLLSEELTFWIMK